MADERYFIQTVECPHCKTKQKVHVAASTSEAGIGDQAIQCIQCEDHFKITIPNKILRGPFPA